MPRDRFVSYAQNLEDVMLWRALGHVSPGCYIDVGAADPTALSVTRAFYDRGWRGIDVEPLPEQAALLAAARPGDTVIQAALAAAPGRAPFYRVRQDGQTGLSTLDGAAAAAHPGGADALEVEVTTLAALCRKHVAGPVHFLKIDVEGAEAAVLAGADFDAVRPWIIVAEANAGVAGWEPGLLASGYRVVWFDGLNRFYVAEEHAELARHFDRPPNVFDHWVQHDPVLQAHLATTTAMLAKTDQLARARLEPEAAPPPPRRPTSPRRRLAMLVWRVLRPVVRPLAWRLRTFLTSPVQEQLAAVRAMQAQTRAHIDLLAQEARARAATAAAAAAKPTPLHPEVAAALERLVLALALEDGRGPALPTPAVSATLPPHHQGNDPCAAGS